MAALAKPKVASSLTWARKKGDARKELDSLLTNLGPDEVRILVRVARRLEFGRLRYGDMNLKKDKRNFKKEATEEILDWLVYTESELEREHQRKSRRRRKS